jgi:hypothetical protein
MDEVVANKHISVLVAPDKGTRGTPKRWLSSGRASWMRSVLRSEHGHERYRKRKQTVEPLFGNTKHNGRSGRSGGESHRGRSMTMPVQHR